MLLDFFCYTKDMDKTNFKDEYYSLVEAELYYLISNANLSKEFKDLAVHYVEHGELGLAFDNIRLGAKDAPEGIQGLIDILSEHLSI